MAKAAVPPPPGLNKKSAAKIFLTLIALAVLYFGYKSISNINRRHQIERRLELDPYVSEIVARMRKEVKDNIRLNLGEGGLRPVAMYVGRARYKVGKETMGNAEPTRILDLLNPVRLEGLPGAKDSDNVVSMSIKAKPRVQPLDLEWWIVTVTRDSLGQNVLYEGQGWPVR